MTTPAARSRSVADATSADVEVEHRRWRTGLEEQACATKIEEGESWWVESGDEVELEHVSVERDGTVQILDVLGDLAKAVHDHVRIIGRLPI